MLITRRMIEDHIRTKKGGFLRKVRDLIGVEYPPRAGWPERLIGREITPHILAQIIDANCIFERAQTRKIAVKSQPLFEAQTEEQKAWFSRKPDHSKPPWD